MPLELPALPYDRTALEPHLSADVLDFHHGHHQRALVERVNALVAGTDLEDRSLDAIVRAAQGALFDHAAQAWNNTFYWHSLRPPAAGGGAPGGKLAEAIAQQFGDVATLRRRFDAAAMQHFGAGWVWLVQRADGRLGIVVTANAATPLTGEDTPLLAASLWEHATYPDHREDRQRYLDAFWQLVSWDSVAARMR